MSIGIISAYQVTYHNQTSILWSKSVLHWDLDVIKGDVGSTGTGTVACLDCGSFHTFSSFDQNHSKATVSAAPDSKVIGKCAICDPFLSAIYDPVLFQQSVSLGP